LAKKAKKQARKKSPPKPRAAPKRPVRKASLSKKRKADSCFILMPFRQPFDEYFDEIFVPAVTAARMQALRGDSLFRGSPIMADVWSLIRHAKLLIAELTTLNANVFYELGLAHAIGKPVILVSETINDVPFDLRQLRVLNYDKNRPSWGTSLKSDITKAILETLAQPTEAVPQMFRRSVKKMRKTAKTEAEEQTEMERRVTNLEFRTAAMLSAQGDQLSSAPAEVSGRPTPHPYDDFMIRLGVAESREDFIRIARRAIKSGIPVDVVRRRMEMILPVETVHAILGKAEGK
jgi:hypothetical protein